jgi:hypothetical protein
MAGEEGDGRARKRPPSGIASGLRRNRTASYSRDGVGHVLGSFADTATLAEIIAADFDYDEN